MADVADLLTAMIGTLEEASHAVQEDLEQLTLPQSPDFPALTKLNDAVRDFAAQADALFMMMVERDAPELLLDRVEDLVEFFQVTQAQIAARMQLKKGRG